jgi:hypothetical protein
MKNGHGILVIAPLFLAAAAAIMPGCAGKKTIVEEHIFEGDTVTRQDARINLYFEIARDMNDGEHAGDVCDALAAAKENMARYRRKPTEFNMTWPGIRQLENENHCP